MSKIEIRELAEEIIRQAPPGTILTMREAMKQARTELEEEARIEGAQRTYQAGYAYACGYYD